MTWVLIVVGVVVLAALAWWTSGRAKPERSRFGVDDGTTNHMRAESEYRNRGDRSGGSNAGGWGP